MYFRRMYNTLNLKGGTQKMELKCTLKEEISQKSGKPYTFLSIMLTPSLEKKVFLDPSEIECIKLVYQANHTNK